MSDMYYLTTWPPSTGSSTSVEKLESATVSSDLACAAAGLARRATDRSAAMIPNESFMLSSFLFGSVVTGHRQLRDVAMVARGSGRAAPPRRPRRASKLSIGPQCGAAHLRCRIATWPRSAWAWGALGMGSARARWRDASPSNLLLRAERDVGGRVVSAAGGVLIRDGAGTVIGAVGISGDVSDAVRTAGRRGAGAPPTEARLGALCAPC